MSDITYIVLGVLTALSTAVVVFVIPWLKSKKTAEEWAVIISKIKQVTSWVVTGVKAAEVFFKALNSGEEKKSYVLDFVKKLCEKAGITFDEDAVSAEIEEVGQDLGLWGKDETKSE